MNSKNLILKTFSVIAVLMLIAAMALCVSSCGKTETPAGTSADTSAPVEGIKDDSKTLGEGKTAFKFSVTDSEGKTESYTINTDKAILGDALAENGIIPASENESGFVNTVNGVTLDWDTDKAYWALYVGESYAEKGVNETEITDGGEYSFVYTKG